MTRQGSGAVAAVLCVAVLALGRDTDGKPAEPTKFRVELAPLKVELSVKAVTEAKVLHEVSVKPEAWAGFTIVSAVEAGSRVKAGDVLVTFDAEKIDRAIRESEIEQRIADIGIKLAELDLPILLQSLPLEKEAAERAKRQADEDLAKFLATDKPLSLESSEQMVKMSRFSLANAQEELKQLEKMYRAKDLTEETEEIILKRQRFAVESATFGVKSSEIRREQSVKVDLPRKEQDLRESVVRATLALEKAAKALPLNLDGKRLSLEKAKLERVKAAEKYSNLKKDRELFTVKSPADGVVYFGRSVNGQWPTAALVAAKLIKGGSVAADEVFITVVPPQECGLRAGVDERDIVGIAPGTSGKVTLLAMPDAKTTVTVERVAAAPVGGTFDVRLKLAGGNSSLLPGLTANVKLVAYSNPKALAVPVAAVFGEDDDEGSVVYVVGKSKPEKRTVQTGKRANGKVEITQGLTAGETVMLKKP